ncbi:MAG: GNAT family N-acetyltransferase [Bacteroidales bacterium]|nr:GNAT family N-acetyltransferase [Bacteroidales bacterium]MCB9013668.1 GNAT family N-acetyltransferase [Bacteroidales bacterium]
MPDKKHIITRDYEPTDYPQLLRLWKETGIGNPERGDNEKIIRNCLKIGGRLMIMEDIRNNTLMGSCWITFDGRRMMLHHFAIKPDYQGKGYGTRLGEEAIAWLRKQGSQVKLEVHKENQIAKKMYKKLGFFAFTNYDIYMIRDIQGNSWHENS